MGKFVCAGAMLQCSMGAAPTMLNVIDPTRPKVQGKPMANIMDNKPFVNVANYISQMRSVFNRLYKRLYLINSHLFFIEYHRVSVR